MRIRWTAGLRFLHPLLSELRGHGKGSRAGNGKPGASEVVAGLENPPCMRRRRDAERNEVVKLRPLPVEKSRYRVARARTVNRHGGALASTGTRTLYGACRGAVTS